MRRKSFAELAREGVNALTTDIAEQGLAAIDSIADELKHRVKRALLDNLSSPERSRHDGIERRSDDLPHQ
jgi:hypothetical protein